MYFVKYGEEFLHDPRVRDCKLLDISLKCEENSCGYCDFTIYPNHKMYDKLKERDSENPIEVYDGYPSDENLLFSGFIYELGKEFQLDGHVKCKGDLAYLSESIIRPYSTHTRGYGDKAPTTVDGYFEWLIEQHNAQVNESKRFAIGINQGANLDSNNYIFRESNKYPDTLSEIIEKLIGNDGVGGYLRIRKSKGVRYIDYLSEWTDSNAQILDFGVNLTNYTQIDNCENISTFIVPLGANMNETNYDYDKGYYITSDKTVHKDKQYYTRSADDKRYIFIGDSYGEGYTPDGNVISWVDKTIDKLWLISDNYYKNSRGGCGFANTNAYYNFLTLIKDLRSSVIDPSTITDIVVCGGYNDHSWSDADCSKGLTAFIDYCKSVYPNAKIDLGFVGASLDSSKTERINAKVQLYRSFSSDYVRFLDGLEKVLCSIDLMSSDKFHPNVKGQEELSIAIVNALNKGECSFSSCSNLTSFESDVTYYEYYENYDESNRPLTISGLSNGEKEPDYIQNEDLIYCESAVKKYGWIGLKVENQELTEKENLVKTGILALKECISPERTIEVKAVDMHLINPDIKPIHIGEYVRVRSFPHNLDSYFLCTSIDLDLNNPENSLYVLGTTFDTLTGQQNKKINELNATINKQYEAASKISEEAKQSANVAKEAMNKVVEVEKKLVDISAGLYLHIRYSENSDGSNMTDKPIASTKYMGIYSGDSKDAPEDPSEYTWALVKGEDGQSVKGENGQSAYLHIKYSNDGETFTDQNGEVAGDWIGTYTDENETDSMEFSKYTWKKIKGEQGTDGEDGISVTIRSSAVEYQTSDSGTIPPTGDWANSVQTTSTDKPYLWTKTDVSYSPSGHTTSYSVSSNLDGVKEFIDSAAKTATNYMNFIDDTGLIIGDMTTGTLGNNVCIDSDSVDIRQGEDVLTSFVAEKKEVELWPGSPYTKNVEYSGVKSKYNTEFGTNKDLGDDESAESADANLSNTIEMTIFGKRIANSEIKSSISDPETLTGKVEASISARSIIDYNGMIDDEHHDSSSEIELRANNVNLTADNINFMGYIKVHGDIDFNNISRPVLRIPINCLEIDKTYMADFVVEEGSNGNLYYRKWYSGKAECWGNYRTDILGITKSYGNLYYSGTHDVTLPMEFKTINNIIATPFTQNNGLYGISIKDYSMKSVTYWVYSAKSEIDITMYTQLRVCGTWK